MRPFLTSLRSHVVLVPLQFKIPNANRGKVRKKTSPLQLDFRLLLDRKTGSLSFVPNMREAHTLTEYQCWGGIRTVNDWKKGKYHAGCAAPLVLIG